MKTVTEQQFKAIIAAVFGVEPSVIVDGLRPGQIPAWDSLGHLSLVSELERSFSFTFSMEESLGINSVADIRAVLAKHGVTIAPV